MGFDETRQAPEIAGTITEGAIRCVRCDHPITTRADRCERAGAHAHTFVNPHGLVFEIRCFSATPGAAQVGPIESAFSWFPGFTWQRLACTRCGAHLGWHFACEPERFAGLIAAALRDVDGGAP